MKSDSAVKITDEQLKALEQRLTAEYEQAAKEVAEKIEKYLKAFEAKDIKKQADLAAGKITEEQYKTWRYGQMMTGKRWTEMKQALTNDLVNVDKVAAQMMNDTLPEIYAENHNYGAYIGETGANIDTSYTLYSKDTVRALAEAEEISLPSAAVNIAKDKKWVAKNVNSAILQGVLQGESIAKISKRLYNVTDMSKNASIRNARTLVTSSENQGRTDSFKRAEKMGIKMEQGWLATLDGRTRHSHRQMDGEWIKVGGTFSNGLKYPGDPSGRAEEVYNCRCTLIGRVNGASMDLTDLSQRNTDHLNGMSYEEWKNAKATSKHYGESVKDYKARALANSDDNDGSIFEKVKNHFSSKNTKAVLCDNSKSVIEKAKALKVEYNQVTKRVNSLSERELIKEIVGEKDEKGSCASLALTYCGQEAGYDVHDYRGGKSRELFASKTIKKEIAKECGAQIISASGGSQYNNGIEVLKQAEPGKKYLLSCGKHAAIVYKNDDLVQNVKYLELQSSNTSNNWHTMNEETLLYRFRASDEDAGEAYLIDVETLEKSEKFIDLLGYINT